MQSIDDAVYKLSDLLRRIILYKTLALTLFEQHSYISVMFHVQAIRHLSFGLIVSEAKTVIMCLRAKGMLESTVIFSV